LKANFFLCLSDQSDAKFSLRPVHCQTTTTLAPRATTHPNDNFAKTFQLLMKKKVAKIEDNS
jgi:hypothetical protein